MAKEDNKQNKPIDTAYISIELSQLEENFGQLDGLPSNPREITEAKMELLKKNIQQYPEMLKLRGLLVYPLDNGKYIIIGGNMRYKGDVGAWLQECALYRHPERNHR